MKGIVLYNKVYILEMDDCIKILHSVSDENYSY